MIRTSIASDIPRIAQEMRDADALEVFYSHKHTPEEALAYSFDASQLCLTLVHRGRPLAMFGLVPTNEGQASIWLLGTDAINEIWLTFLRLSREIVTQFLDLYPSLFNYIDAGNEVSLRWLEWLGAKFGPPEPYGAMGCMFRRFVIERNGYV